MVVLIDTREQKPLRFPSNGILTGTRRVTLPVGDYGCEFTDGTRPPLAFERKNLSDLFSTMGTGYPRFKREMQKAKDLNIHLILIIEGTLGDVYTGPPHSQLAGSSIAKKLFTLWVRYDLQPVFCSSRREMVCYIQEAYEAIGREHRRNAPR